MNTEQAEDEARQQQSRRDSQIAASKRQKGSAWTGVADPGVSQGGKVQQDLAGRIEKPRKVGFPFKGP